MIKRIFHSILFAAVSVFLTSSLMFMAVLYNYFSGVSRGQLKMQTNLAAQGVANEGYGYFEGLATDDYRVTWIAADGAVLYDSESDAAEMENHLEREEVRRARTADYGESSRYSSTLTERYFYCAKYLPDGTVLRLSVMQNTVFALFVGMSQPICVILAIAFLLSMALALRLSKAIVKPLNELDLDDPLGNEGYDELSPLLRRIDMQQRRIKEQSDELLQKQKEFETVTSGMSEGIILLNDEGVILSMNEAACRLFEVECPCDGKSMLSVNRSPGLTDLLHRAENGAHVEMVMELRGGRYQLNANPVVLGAEASGTVLLLLDVTEKEKSEQIRREFTANVSHELKTPLHTISGCAELMKNGIVKREDVPKFAEQIYTESQRMIHLVEDIIKLSHLDEGADDMNRDEVDLYQLAQETIRTLSAEAESLDVRMELRGEKCIVYGIPQLLGGILYNLCDNAIKYNRRGGSVIVTARREARMVSLVVSDTGIGIPAEHQERVFERFYRVDKSRSKEIGGTGLGLSIVKHSAKLHDAIIELHSVVAQGTTVTVRFPAMD